MSIFEILRGMIALVEEPYIITCREDEDEVNFLYAYKLENNDWSQVGRRPIYWLQRRSSIEDEAREWFDTEFRKEAQ